MIFLIILFILYTIIYYLNNIYKYNMCIFKDCDLSFLFGVENEGIHKYRVLDSPIVDHVVN